MSRSIATIVLSVIAASVAVGSFLWLAAEARVESVEERLTVLETEVKGMNERLKAVEEGLRRIENILLYRLGAAPMAPGAGEP